MSKHMPFSSSRKAGPFIFASGKVGVDPIAGDIAKGDVGKQTLKILDNMESELQQYGLGLQDVVKTTVFLTDMRLFDDMNAAYKTRFSDPLPARSCVSVSAVPHVDALVEIELIAWTEK